MSKSNEIDLWHKRMGYLNMRTWRKLLQEDLSEDFIYFKEILAFVCKDCKMGKQTKAVHKNTTQINTRRPLELLHMDLMGSMQVESIGGKKYLFVCVDDYTQYF